MMRRIFYFLIIIYTIFFVSLNTQFILNLFTKASPQKANIILDTRNMLGPVKRVWSGLAQGGEEPPPMLSNLTSLLRPLNPQYIRIDHIYDYYKIIENDQGKIEYDFSLLDDTVEDIISAGALPFFSLSYMPPLFTLSGSVIDQPRDWTDWQNLVTATIEHYSGKQNKNLSNIYYEVWNEPELVQFGKFRLTDDKDYRLLYFYSAKGAENARDVNQFYLGGPAVGSYYANWVTDFISYINQNNLKFDFYSWHRYHKNINIFSQDAQKIRQNLSGFPKFAKIPLFLTEWGLESENKEINNSNLAAAFTIAAVSRFYDDLDLSFVFEIKDGPPPSGGKWGLVTHEKATDPLKRKPKYLAFEYLSKLDGEKISLSGEGTFVRGIGVKSDKIIKLLLANYDSTAKNFENVPVTIVGLEPYIYQLKYAFPLEDNFGNVEIPVTSGKMEKSFIMRPNSFLYLEISPLSPIAQFIPGKTDKAYDQSLILSSVNPLIYTSAKFSLPPWGTISFDIKPFWTQERSLTLLEMPVVGSGNNTQKIVLLKSASGLLFGINDQEGNFIDFPVVNWKNDKWYHLNLGWNDNKLSLSFDNNQEIIKPLTGAVVSNGQNLTIFPVPAAIDNLTVVIGENPLIGRLFNGRIDR